MRAACRPEGSYRHIATCYSYNIMSCTNVITIITIASYHFITIAMYNAPHKVASYVIIKSETCPQISYLSTYLYYRELASYS